MLGEFIKRAIREQEIIQSNARVNYLSRLPINTFSAIYDDCDAGCWAGGIFNGVYYSELEIYVASLRRDEGYEAFL
ncbi:hypothetical protein [Pectobacterium versatile]|uniref:hypothetical protein n=1 Tax=Pectobacterium versatile TaxID=2488639 RepID=UPI001B391D76|nr:hypothetical protein [Pectobacterium versatile]MBQ4777694.1 hypothetical protein [Pectobacterium versatile]